MAGPSPYPGARRLRLSTLISFHPQFPLSVAEFFSSWYDFNVVTGAAAATPVGLRFVTASVGSPAFTEHRRVAFRSFVSPGIVHFLRAFGASLVAPAPLRHWMLIRRIEGSFGLADSAIAWRPMIPHGRAAGPDLERRICYGALPTVSYAIMPDPAIRFFAAWAVPLAVLAPGAG